MPPTTTSAPAPAPAAAVLPWLGTAARVLLGAVWIVAGASKITDLDASVRAVRAYRLLPDARSLRHWRPSWITSRSSSPVSPNGDGVAES